MTRAGIAILLVAFGAFAQISQRDFDKVRRLTDTGRIDEAETLSRRLLDEAMRTGNRAMEAEACRTIGQLLVQRARFTEARAQYDRAMEMFRQAGDRAGAGRVWMEYGHLEGLTGDPRRETEAYRQALAEFEAADSPRDRAGALQALAGVTANAAEKKRLTGLGLELARAAGDRTAESKLLVVRSDILYGEGDLAGALAEAEKAAAWFEQEARNEDLSRAITRIARVYGVHGQKQKAVDEYLRALAVVEKTGHPAAIATMLNAVSVGYSRFGPNKETVEYSERALAMARKSGSPNLIQRQLLGLGAALSVAGEYARAAKFIDEAVAGGAPAHLIPWRNLAMAYRVIGDPRALTAADRAVESGRETNSSTLADSLRMRAIIRKEKGNLPGSLRDVEDGIELIEQRRRGTVQTDEMKRSYSAETFRLFALAVEVLHTLGRHAEAVSTVERARARAFVDLMATRDVQLKAGDKPELETLRALDREVNPAAATEEQKRRLAAANPELRSFVNATPVSAAEIAATAARLGSTLVIYWHNISSTYVFVAKADGKVYGVRVAVKRDNILKLIAEAGAAAAPAAARGEPAIPTRGGSAMQARVSGKGAYRELHRVLIEPVRHLLPTEEGSLLTIVPHGPLFQVSFAALLDEKGRYLAERHRLHYVPSVGVLQFTANKRGAGQRKVLVVADPAGMTASDGKPLPSLPGTRREARAIASVSGGGATLLTGTDAAESRVRAAAQGKDVVHFATHGVVREDIPGQSFLALAKPAGKGLDDGRLTANEVYGLDLNADLVVLSACRSARGAISTDGVLGLSRAFFYAGTPSVMATMWDVADEPTSRLVAGFYRQYARKAGKSEALRQAQLRLIADLRGGRVRVDTPLGPVTLPEHPLFWAGFVLAGEP